MKKRGFTLIELLAVIVVLAIIALIATPIAMNTIKRSKKGSIERSASNYVKQVEVAIATSKLAGNEVLDGTYTIGSEGNLIVSSLPEGKLKVEMNGTKPNSGKIKITNGIVDQSSSEMTIGDYDVKYNFIKKAYEATEKGNTPQVEVLCTAIKTATAGNIPSGKYIYGDEYTCELGDNDAKTFFVLETNGDNVSLIMDRNIDSNGKGTTSGNTVAWCKSGSDNSCAADGALEYLKTSTTSWTKLTESQISLPTGQQIATAGRDTDWNTDKYGSGFESKLWLYINLSESHEYWTSTSYSKNNTGVWSVNDYGELGSNDVSDTHLGVRPVITLLKSQLREAE